MDMSGDGKISVQDMNRNLQPSPYTNYITLAPAVRYMVPNNFKDRGTFIFMGKLTLESEEVTFLHNSGEIHNQQHSVTPQRTQILTYATVKASNLPNSYPSKILP